MAPCAYLDSEFIERVYKAQRSFLRLVPDPALLEDLAQEVLLQFLEGKGKHQTVDQAYYDACRKAFQWRHHKGCVNPVWVPLEDAGEPPNPGPSVEEKLEAFQRVLALPPAERTLLYCYYWLGHDLKRLARRAGVMPRKIERDLERILRSLG